MYHANVNVNLREENVIQIKSGITMNVNMSVKNIYVRNIIFGILLHVIKKMENLASIIDDSVSTYDEIMDKNSSTKL